MDLKVISDLYLHRAPMAKSFPDKTLGPAIFQNKAPTQCTFLSMRGNEPENNLGMSNLASQSSKNVVTYPRFGTVAEICMADECKISCCCSGTLPKNFFFGVAVRADSLIA